MLARVVAIALNTYREAVRARLLLGVLAVALATCAYSVVVAALSLHNEVRVVADLGAASGSFYGVLIVVMLGSTSLYRELEHKTIFPILSRPMPRWEYVVGKYFGTLLTAGVFVTTDAATVLVLLALEAGQARWKVVVTVLSMMGVLALTYFVARKARAQYLVFAAIPLAVIFATLAWLISNLTPDERQLVTASAALSLCELAIVSAVATLFSSFSSPFLTAAFTVTVVVIGRSADTLGHLPKRQLGATVTAMGRALARIIPNLHTYVPPRPLLLGVSNVAVWRYVGSAALQAVSYATLLLILSALAFRRRDFA
ncbi:MAG: ABC transporter permease [Myxococcota bacterium]|nr:ABC transporter permease [Myxococcota bacterium]